MRVLIFLAFVLAAVALAVQAKQITVIGYVVEAKGLNKASAQVSVDNMSSVKYLGIKICLRLKHITPTNVIVGTSENLLGRYNIDSSVYQEGIKRGEKIYVSCS